jgi:3',5'-cyclic AMP phosphodiesterase CpdA
VTIRIAHLSDIHFGAEQPAAAEAALAAVAEFAPTVTVVTGDITLNGLPREFVAARAWLDRLPHPILVTPGNHDTPYWNLALRALTPFARYRRYIGRADAAAFDGPGLAVRSLNSARGAQLRLNWSKGAMDIDPLKRIDWGGSGQALKVFACHHPLIEIEGAPVTGGVRRGAKAAAVLAEAGVELILTGHVHIPFVTALPLTERSCHAVGAGTLSLRTRGSPASFSIIAADDAQIEVTAQGWTGDRFEPLRSWRFARERS